MMSYFQFKSYCSSHRPSQKVQRQNQANGISCQLCQEPVIARPSCPKSLYAPCCSAWLHRSCVQNLALKQSLQCPACFNTDKFGQEMQKFGVYTPQRRTAEETTVTLPWDPSKESKVKECGAKVRIFLPFYFQGFKRFEKDLKGFRRFRKVLKGFERF